MINLNLSSKEQLLNYNLIIIITTNKQIRKNMDIQAIFNSDFHKNAIKFNRQLINQSNQQWKLKNIKKTFPLTNWITKGDVFYQCVWKAIDNAEKYFWISTYAIDSSPAADITLYKLIDAAKRGVHVVLFIDNVQSWAKKELVNQLKGAGGKFMILNPQFQLKSIYNYFTKDVWRRHHEKLIVSDNMSLIGSSNIEGNYAGIRYGNSTFQDINFYTQNIILDQYRKHFTDTANFYQFDLKTGLSDQQQYEQNNDYYLKYFNQLYPNSQFYPTGKYTLLHNDQKRKKRQIQKDVINRIKQAKQQIKVIQPYHYTMSRFQRNVNKAIRKYSITPEIITSGKRDQPVFKEMSNEMLFERLLNKGVTLYETRQGLLHSKIYMFDKRWINTGSMNNDRWSWMINNQCNILIDDPREYVFVDMYFQKVKKKCRQVRPGYEISVDQADSINFWQWFLYLSQIVMSQVGNPEQDYRKV